MVGLFDKKAETFLQAGPTYPSEWYLMLAARTSHYSLAWDIGTGNGQAALGVAEHYQQVIATDLSEAQLSFAMPYPRVRYVRTPQSMSEDEMVTLMGGKNCVDLITVATAVHWFDLPKFYKRAKRLLRRPEGILAIWAYNDIVINPEFNTVSKHFWEASTQFWHLDAKYVIDGYRNLPFPFESVGLGHVGKPMQPDILKELLFEGYLKYIKSSSAFALAKEQGVGLSSEEVINSLRVLGESPLWSELSPTRLSCLQEQSRSRSSVVHLVCKIRFLQSKVRPFSTNVSQFLFSHNLIYWHMTNIKVGTGSSNYLHRR